MPSLTPSPAWPKRVTWRKTGLRDGLLSIASVMADLQAGETRLDSCLGGIGAYPHASGRPKQACTVARRARELP